MNVPEYANLEKVERNHWYYAGKRDIVRHWINRCRPLGLSDILLDYGAGTGLFASEWLGQCQVRVFDSYPQSQEILRRRFPAECVLTNIASAALEGKVACVTALDVLEHLEDDARAVREFHRVLQPGGIAVITVPADMRLWSDWDESLLHFRRYGTLGTDGVVRFERLAVDSLQIQKCRGLPGNLCIAKVAKSRAGGAGRTKTSRRSGSTAVAQYLIATSLRGTSQSRETMPPFRSQPSLSGTPSLDPQMQMPRRVSQYGAASSQIVVKNEFVAGSSGDPCIQRRTPLAG